jgi:hypothetical protein
MITEPLGRQIPIRSDNKTIIVIILNMIISPPQGNDTSLKVMGIDDADGMEVYCHFNCAGGTDYLVVQDY